MSDSEISAQLALLAINAVPLEAEERICARSIDLVHHRNQGNVSEFVAIFSPHSVFFDADGLTIEGQDEIENYATALMEFGMEHGSPSFELKSKNIFADGPLVIYDVGAYNWPTIENGRYIHKWIWDEDDFYLHQAYYTIDEMFLAVPAADEINQNGD